MVRVMSGPEFIQHHEMKCIMEVTHSFQLHCNGIMEADLEHRRTATLLFHWSAAYAGPDRPGFEQAIDDWMKQFVEFGEYLGDQDWVEILLREQPKRLQELEDWG
ncbi:hypothetical protein LCGC14_3053770, partial [marine sediment metagenome]